MEQHHENVSNATEATFSGFDLDTETGQLAAWEAICRGELRQPSWEDEESMDWIWVGQPRKLLAWKVRWHSDLGRANHIVDLSSLPPPPVSPKDHPQEALDWLVQAAIIKETLAKVYLLSLIDEEKAMQQLHLDLLEGRKIYLQESPWGDYDYCLGCVCEFSPSAPSYPRLHYVTEGHIGEPVKGSIAESFVLELMSRRHFLGNVQDLEMLLEDERLMDAGLGFRYEQDGVNEDDEAGETGE